MTPPLYTASVPVFRHYLGTARALLKHQTPERLSTRLAPDMFTCAEQFATAAGFALRGSYPLAGVPVPDFPDLGMDADGLKARFDFALARLDTLEPAAFEGAETRRIEHRAGFAELDQSGRDYLSLFAMPNFLFHLSMAFAILRQTGATIGKVDFDGLHDYPHGFRF
ncbi:MAG: DUF1993 domain-containing protein [Pseudomonadota bacterium]